jgi:hypothetical protein
MGKRFTQSLVLGLCLVLGAGLAFAQMTTTGRMIGTVTDPTGAVVAGADVTATDEATGKTYETKSGSDGGFVFSNLQPGSYTVTVAMQGFKKAEVRAVKIVVGGQRGLNVQLELGEMASTVVIEAGTEILQTSETKVGTTITGKAITQLPFTSRDALDLAILMPGASTVGRPRATSFMGLPKGAMNITMDGINAQDNVLKSSDGFFTLIRPRVDSMEEFSISTAAAGANETGEGAVQIRFETKRGTNEFHGGAWWYHRNDKFNSNYYFNNEVAPGSAATPKQRQRLNQFGLKVGGPILKEKLFFFTAFDFYRNPESRSRTRTILTTEASAGIFRYSTGSTLVTPSGAAAAWTTCGPTVTPGTTGFECAANLLTMAAASGFPSTIDLTMGGYISAVNTVVGVPGVSVLTPPSRYQRSVRFNNGGAGRRNFPDFRFDYNLNKNHLITAIYHYNYFTSTPDFLNGFDATYPVAPFNGNIGSQISNRNQLTAAWRWNIGTTKTNEVRVGLVSSPVAFFPDLNINLYPQITTNLGTLRANPGFSGMNSPLLGYATQGRNGGIMQLIDTFGWSWGKHNFSFGGNWTYSYWKGYFDSAAVGSVGLGIVSTDPAFSVINWATGMPGSNSTDQGNARGIYGMLVGRVTSFSAAAPLNFDTRQFEQGIRRLLSYYQNEFAFYATDNWRLFSTLTMNVGVRWEIQPSADTKSNFNELFRVRDGLTGLAGRSCSLDRLFQPGSATCAVSSYEINNNADWWQTDWNAFAPSVGQAWTPNLEGDVMKWIFGGPGKSVFRAGYSIAYTREGMNNFSSIAGSNPGFTSSLSTSAVGTVVSPGQFLAGSVMLADGFIPNVTGTPPAFVESFSLSPQTASQSLNIFDPNLQIPYVQSWQVGWQREITPSTVVEVRYVGNHGTGLWRQFNWNETNIVENGFLTEFLNAKNNLAICRATAGCTLRFSNQGLPGQVNVPIMTAAFTGSTSGSQTNTNFASSARILNLDENQVGSFAGAISGLTNWNNLVAAGYPANFWVLNPDARGGVWIMGNSSHTTYNGLQIEVRRKPAKGLQYSGSYTFSKSLTDYFGDSSVSAAGFDTLRDRGRNKGYSPWDLRHNFKLQLIYEMPFGPGRRWSSSQGWLNRIIEGWEINTITRWQSGRVFNLSGGLGGTFNGSDGGVELIGITAQQIQESLQIRKEPNGQVFWFPAEMIGADGRANTAIMRPCQTAGQFCQRLFLYGPSFFRADWSVVKRTRITEKVNIEYRAEFLNAFNNINFFFGGGAATTVAGTNLRSTSFGRVFDAYQDTSTTDDPGGRLIQMVLRINF